MKRWQTLAENGSLIKLKLALLSVPQDTGAGKGQKLLNTAEGKAVLAAAIKYENINGAMLRSRDLEKRKGLVRF